jgi:hypothetical protein
LIRLENKILFFFYYSINIFTDDNDIEQEKEEIEKVKHDEDLHKEAEE